jgi:hypothetical protein
VLGHDVDTVISEGLTGKDDTVVWSAAQNEGRFLITQDIGIADARAHSPGTHHGVMLVRLREPGREAIVSRVAALFESEATQEWAGSVIVATERKLRVRR